MKRFVTVVMLFVMFGALGLAWSSDVSTPMRVSVKRRYTPKHHAHKAGHHHRPKHHRTV